MEKRLKVLFISPLFSPFQIEVGEALRRQSDIDYRIAFGMLAREARGQPHWLNYDYDPSRYPVMPDSRNDPAQWYAEEIAQIRPDVLISGQIVGSLHQAVMKTWRNHDYVLGYWMEPPDFTRPWHVRKAASAAARVRLSFADFVLAIGDRAERYLRRMAPGAEVRLLPYGEDLSACLSATTADKTSDRMRFLFSGQLRSRHNIDQILAALVSLSERHRSFSFTFSGKGPEHTAIEACTRAHPRLQRIIRFESEFESWVDRLRPFREHHVLVYPCQHAGWGLVIPEAMAAGMPVITTRHAEAGRYFVRHRVSGIFIEPTAEELIREMDWCIRHPDDVRVMGERAREAARDGDAPGIARQLVKIVREQVARGARRDSKAKAAYAMARVADKAIPR